MLSSGSPSGSEGARRGWRSFIVRTTVGRLIPDIHIPDIHIVFDCADPDRLARYDFPHGPPDGFATWEEWADANGIPEEERNAGRTLVDEQGNRPDIFFLRVPEPKTTKNRVHLDVKVGSGLPDAERRARIEEVANRLRAVGGSVSRRIDHEEGFWLVMQDPEGNEFCVN
ncbi:VOC family protein [Nonomuraea sp. NPDC048826]|uniref:VOC family protein n=1 Tax=Nonomuraea sp. NPDC048826 TaxID=3364347 RepID=UPI0037170D1A